MITAYESFCLYQSLKLHFTTDSFDFFKYGGKSKVTVSAFENRKDKWHFAKLSRKFSNKDDLVKYIVANFIEDEKSWVGSLLEEQGELNFRKRQKVLQSLSYFFENDCQKIFDGVENPNEVLTVEDGEYPILLKMYLQKEIQIETLCILNEILGFMGLWNRKISDTIVWPNHRMKIQKFAAFLPKDIVKYKLILKKVIS
jgi:hypothetical protein